MFRLWMDIAPCAEALALITGQLELIGPAASANAPHPLFEIEHADAAIVRTSFPGSEQTFARTPHLKVIARTGIGYDNIDLEAATRHGICVVTAPDAPTISVAEFTFALMLGVARRIPAADRQLHSGVWSPYPDLIGIELHRRVLGLVGFGRTGSRVAHIARAFEMKVLVCDPFISAERAAEAGVSLMPDLPSLLRQADIVSLHLPLTSQTRGIIGKTELALMKPGAILINVARGPLVDEVALLASLDAGALFGAGIDVWTLEPMPSGSPLAGSERVLGTPHIAGTTQECVVRAQTTAVEAVLMVLRGEYPPSLINPDAWRRHPPFNDT